MQGSRHVAQTKVAGASRGPASFFSTSILSTQQHTFLPKQHQHHSFAHLRLEHHQLILSQAHHQSPSASSPAFPDNITVVSAYQQLIVKMRSTIAFGAIALATLAAADVTGMSYRSIKHVAYVRKLTNDSDRHSTLHGRCCRLLCQ